MTSFRTLASALASTTCLVALASPAQAQPRQFDIPAGSLKDGLRSFISQSGMQLIYRESELGSAKSPRVVGNYEPSEALKRLLQRSGFKAIADSSGAKAIIRDDASGNASGAATGAATTNARSGERRGSTGVPAAGGSQSRQRDKANAKFKRRAARAGRARRPPPPPGSSRYERPIQASWGRLSPQLGTPRRYGTAPESPHQPDAGTTRHEYEKQGH